MKRHAAENTLLDEAKRIRAERTAARRKETVAKLLATTNQDCPLVSARRYPVILADPPWQFSQGKSFGNRSPENHYPTMSTADICALPVKALATKEAILFIWTPNAHICECLLVIAAWGFEYVSNVVWVKNRIGLGRYVRTKHELMLIAKKGDIVTPETSARPASVLIAPRLKHSEKPADAYRLIERMYPDFPKIELFARQQQPGWDVWGNQAPRTVPTD